MRQDDPPTRRSSSARLRRSPRLALLTAVAIMAALIPAPPTSAAVVSVRWTQRSRAGSPVARFEVTLATHPATDRVLLFGGYNNGLFGDTWTWDGRTWTEQHPPSSPPPRSSDAMAVDPSTGRVVLFGGAGSTGAYLGDTWTWDGATWTQQHPATSPPARGNAAMATDPSSGRIVLFGGVGNELLGDTWTWDGTTWTEQHPASSPPRRTVAAMASDPVRGHVVLFGGTDGARAFRDTWTWDGTTWTKQHPVVRPPARFEAAMATDPGGRQVVLFGGNDGPPSYHLLADTWTWDGTAWTEQHPPTAPSARERFAIAADPHGRVTLFGGEDGRRALGDTWSLTPSLTITPNTGPPGTVVKVRGFGYTSGATVTVVKYRTSQLHPPGPYSVICSATVSADSRFECSGQIPTAWAAGAPGPHDVVAKDSAGLKSATIFTLT